MQTGSVAATTPTEGPLAIVRAPCSEQRHLFTPAVCTVESPHDTIHVLVGGLNPDRSPAGDMSDPAVAAFDPIFFLHHANVDRWLATWQARHSGWVVAHFEVARGEMAGTMIQNPGAPIDAATKLTPFHRRERGVWKNWTSKEVKNTADLGYTVPVYISSRSLAVCIGVSLSVSLSLSAFLTTLFLSRSPSCDVHCLPCPNNRFSVSDHPIFIAHRWSRLRLLAASGAPPSEASAWWTTSSLEPARTPPASCSTRNTTWCVA